MTVVTTFPHAVRHIENIWIPLPDGTRLAARMWLPEDADDKPVPAVIECVPYRKRDGLRYRDDEMHPYVAGHGYAVLRIDLRGTGESDGLPDDEYTPAEQADLVAAIDWIARQSWCAGRVGMMGISWGGFNALQVAAHRPPALRAIITVDASDDRYNDDVHYMQGVLLHDNFSWASAMYAYAVLPPDPEIVGDIWREAWLARLRHYRFPFHIWGGHQRRDAYWRQASVIEDYTAIACPVFAIGGWEDGYSNAVPRLCQHIKAPVKGWIGPWGHAYPHNALPGPQAGFLQEALRWWDRWLKDIDTGVERDPRLIAWMNDSYTPDPCAMERPGRWIAETDWPSPRIETRKIPFGDRRLGATESVTLAVKSPQNCGLGSVEWCSYGDSDGDYPDDQRADDGMSLCFDGAMLAERLEIFGQPIVELAFSVDRPVARVAVRLNDVAADGTSTRVTFCVFSLNHKDDQAAPVDLEPGRRYSARIPLNYIAHAFLPGHRLRVAVSTNYWPMMMPAPEAVTLSLHTDGCQLFLPVRPSDTGDPPIAVPPAEAAPPAPGHVTRPGRSARDVQIDIAAGETVLVNTKDAGGYHFSEIGVTSDCRVIETYRIRNNDPLSYRVEISYEQMLKGPDWEARTVSVTSLAAARDVFHITARMDAFDSGVRIFSDEESYDLPRDYC
ncbi:MAG: CocE/NonD family hydrolase [Rhodospirillaceae bacterium]|nr:CocE/NonD family hydrolase [Rhodospirillaceae bacterium]